VPLAVVDALRDSRAFGTSLRTTTPARRASISSANAKRGEPVLAGDPGRLGSCVERSLIPSEAVVQQGRQPVRCGEAQSLAHARGKSSVPARTRLVNSSSRPRVGGEPKRAIPRSESRRPWPWRGHPTPRTSAVASFVSPARQVDADGACSGRAGSLRQHSCFPRTSNVVSREQVPSPSCSQINPAASTGQPGASAALLPGSMSRAREGRQRLPQTAAYRPRDHGRSTSPAHRGAGRGGVHQAPGGRAERPRGATCRAVDPRLPGRPVVQRRGSNASR